MPPLSPQQPRITYVYVRSEKDESLTREQIADITIQTTNAEGETEEIKVGDIADFEDSVSPQAINRDGQSRYMSVTAEIASGYNIGLVSQDVQKILDKYTIPEGYTVEMKGEDESINEAMGQLLQMLALALVFMYLIMVAQFQSLLSPFIIMFTIPLAFTGGFLGLLVSNKPVSIVAMVGFVMLSGIIVNNGIVLVDYINQLRKDGMEKRAAIRSWPCPSAPHCNDSAHHHPRPCHYGYGHGYGCGYGAAHGNRHDRRFDLRYTADPVCGAVYL